MGSERMRNRFSSHTDDTFARNSFSETGTVLTWKSVVCPPNSASARPRCFTHFSL